MGWQEILEEVADEFIENPLDFVTEDDVKVRLAHRLHETLEASPDESAWATWKHPKFEASSEIRNRATYRALMQQKLEQAGRIRRVHTEPDTQADDEAASNFVDVVVFRDQITGTLYWVNAGSKRYPRDDIEVAIELKFVKNIRKPETPTHGENAVDMHLYKDIESLRSRTAATTQRYCFVISLFDHLYVDGADEDTPTQKQHAEWGTQAQQWLEENAGDVQILYVTPKGREWLTD